MDIMEKLGEFFPLIIFLFWVIFGVLFKSAMKNRAKPPGANRPEQNERPRTPPKKASSGKLKDAIQMVLEEMDLSGREEVVFSENGNDEEADVQSATFTENTPVVSESPRRGTTSEKLVVQEQPYKRTFMHPYRIDQGSEGIYVAGMPARLEEIRRGIIWSEILSPPLALRETDRVSNV